jgi:cysteine-rich repeat protein
MRSTNCLSLVLWIALAACGDDGAPMGDAGRGDAGRRDAGDDPCSGIATCAIEGTSCRDDVVLTCARNAEGCRVLSENDCASTGMICEESGGAAMCVDDECAGVAPADRCVPEGVRCEGEVRVVCAPNAMGCLVRDETDCAASPGGVCDDSGAEPVCAEPADPCASIPAGDRCATAGTSCDGVSLVTCAPNAFGCLVESRADCSSRAGGTCDAAAAPPACTFTGDPCDGVVECDAAGTSCVGPELTVCAADAFGCLVETRTDCTSEAFGFCDEDAAPPICSTAALDPCLGMATCPAAARECDGDTLRVCARNAFGCLVESATDCAVAAETCGEIDATPVCGSVCDFVETCPATSYCDAGEAVTCAIDGDGCLVETARASCSPDSTCFAAGCTAACAGASPIVLDCASGTVSGDTTGGPTAIAAYAPCTTSTAYAGSERVFFFVNDGVPAEVEITSHRGAADGDYDLFVLAGGDGSTTCGAADTCVGASRGTGEEESVEFVAGAGSLHYVVYDIFDDDAATSAFTLDVVCTPIVCGDGVIAGGEACDDANTASSDGCSASCEIEPGYECSGAPSTCALACGDGVPDDAFGETCDDGGIATGDGCSASCAFEAGFYCAGLPSVCTSVMCGDSTVGPGESCDPASATCSARCALAIAASGSSISLGGALEATDPTYVRANADCTARTSETPHAHDAFVLENTTGADQSLTLTASYTQGTGTTSDGYLFVYRYPFNPALQLYRCAAGDDDFADAGSQIVDLHIASGERVVVIATTFGGGETIGGYSIEVATE